MKPWNERLAEMCSVLIPLFRGSLVSDQQTGRKRFAEQAGMVGPGNGYEDAKPFHLG